jgi:hypothetical protein
LYIGNLYLGATVDFAMLKKELKNFNYQQLKVWVDLGFIGIKKNVANAQIQIGHKRKKNTALTEEQKLENQAISKISIVVAHAIGGLKRYYILRNENRMKKPEENSKLDTAVEICAALWNFKRGFTTKCA